MANMRGLEAVLAGFHRLPSAVTDAAEASLDQATDELVAAERRNAPVSELEAHPGQLRDSIEKYPTPGRPLSFRIIVGARDSKGRLFGRYVQFGHTTPDGKFVPARPWFFEIYRALKKRLRRAIMAGPRKAIRQLFPKVR
jgi:hypothetical protein